MKKFKQLFLSIVVLNTVLFAQGKPKVKWNITTQFWARYSELNNGTTINGEATDTYTDISIRRLRIPVTSQITPKIYGYAMFGGNNFNHQSRNFPLQVLDLYVEYAFSKKLEVGMGKSGWQGLDRWNVRSSKSLMGLDSPLFSLTTVNKDDDLGRNLSIWFKGQIVKFDYRFVISNPITVSKAPVQGIVDYANNRPRKRVSSYIKYQFFEEESNKSAYQTGTYINKKKVFNIGFGGQFQGSAFADGDVLLATTKVYDMKTWAVDSFLSLPLAGDKGITAYLGYYNLNFGTNYIRNVDANGSIFDSGSGTTFNGDGNGFPMMGTGTTIYTQFGYAFPIHKQIVAQPNIAIQYSDFDALNQEMIVYDFTINLFLNGMGHRNKLSLGYQYRPVFDTINLKEMDRKGMTVLKYQITLK
ncbi:porin [Wenyingzhuangia sp. IMCC45533]